MCKVTPVIPHGFVSPECEVTPEILHGVVSPECKLTPVILHGVVSPERQVTPVILHGIVFPGLPRTTTHTLSSYMRGRCARHSPLSDHPRLPDSGLWQARDICPIEQWSQSSGSNVIPRRARPGLAGLSSQPTWRLEGAGGPLRHPSRPQLTGVPRS